MKQIILCADDYGQNTAISQAIIELLQEKHISATSCLVTSANWHAQAAWLSPFKNNVDIGLHFNLTEGAPLSKELSRFFSLKELLLKSHLKSLPKKAIAQEFRAQLDQFVSALGQLPHFIDGHQHIHQIPIIRDILLDLYEERLREDKPYVRCTFSNVQAMLNFRQPAWFKQLIIQLAGGMAFKKILEKRHIPHNSSFGGIYHFSDSYDYENLFPYFIKYIQNNGIIMCHPSLMSSENDLIVTARHNEYLYLSSENLSQACQNEQAHVARFRK